MIPVDLISDLGLTHAEHITELVVDIDCR